MDKITKNQRSAIMSKIRSKNTLPELAVRKALWKEGLRYKIHDKSITGIPDISNKSKKIAIFIDGCFWHGCPVCYNKPKSNVAYWEKKLEYNKSRRSEVKKKLTGDGWQILEFWECEITNNLEAIVFQAQKCFNEQDVGK